LKTSYTAGTFAFPANARYLLRHANDSLAQGWLAEEVTLRAYVFA
jgi:hypothetical protein